MDSNIAGLAKEARALTHLYVTQLEPYLIAIVKRLSDRTGAQYSVPPDERMIYTIVRKAMEDIASVCHLSSGPFPGPSTIIVRTIRMEVLQLVYIVLADTDERERALRAIEDYDVADNSRRLRKAAADVLASMGDRLGNLALQRLQSAIENGLSVNEYPNSVINANKSMSFNKTLGRVLDLLSDAPSSLELDLLATSCVDYWKESEVVHCGRGALQMYCLDGKTLAQNQNYASIALLVLIQEMNHLAELVEFAVSIFVDGKEQMTMTCSTQDLYAVREKCSSHLKACADVLKKYEGESQR